MRRARAREIYPQSPAPDEDGWWARGPETVGAHAWSTDA